MVGKSFAALLPFAIMLSLVEDAFALRPPFTKRDTSSTPAPSTLPMPLQFDGRGGYQVAVSLSTSNPQKFNFTISTGTGLTLAAGQNCTNCSNTPLYNQGASSSAMSLSANDSTDFFGGAVNGVLIKENCGALLGNGTFWQYPNQTVVVADQQSLSLLSNGISGVMGLGTNGGATGTSSGISFIDSIYGQFLNRTPSQDNFTFGMMLNSPPTQGNSSAGSDGGVLHWMSPDESFFDASKVTFKTVTAPDGASNASGTTVGGGQDWTVELDGWVTTTGNNRIINQDSVVAIVDPLYEGIYLPHDQAALVHDAINGSSLSSVSTLPGISQAYTIPCDADFTFGLLVGSQTFVLNSQQLVLQQENGGCVSAVESFIDPTVQTYLLGSRFIGTAYLIFNIPRNSTPTLGFAPLISSGSKSTNVGAIVGGTVAGVAAVVILGLAAFWYLRRRTNWQSGTLEIEPTDKHTRQSGVEPYTIGAPTPAQPSFGLSTFTSETLLLGQEVHMPLAPPSYEEASSSTGSPVTQSSNLGREKGRRVPAPFVAPKKSTTTSRF